MSVNVVYRTSATANGGRDGESRTDDGALAVKLGTPTEMGGNGTGNNPEQLFAAGYAACFLGALGVAAGKMKLALPPDVAVDAEVDLGPIPDAFSIAVRLKVSLPGIANEQAHKLVEAAHVVCPYSNATRDNIDVHLSLA